MEKTNFIEIPSDLDRVWIFKYAVTALLCYDADLNSEVKKNEYGFCIGRNFVDAVNFLESYYGEELDSIECLEPINHVAPVAKSKRDWEEIAESLSWGSDKLEPYIG